MDKVRIPAYYTCPESVTERAVTGFVVSVCIAASIAFGAAVGYCERSSMDVGVEVAHILTHGPDE